MKTILVVGFSGLILLLGTLAGCKKSSPQVSESVALDPSEFTTAEKIDLPGCGNLYKVSGTLYRGKQPTGEGFKELDKLGI